MRHPRLAVVLALLAVAACDRAGSPGPEGADQAPSRAAAKAAREGQRLRDITERYFDRYLELDPLAASAQGDRRYDDRLGNYASLAWMADWLAIEQESLQALAAIDPARLAGEDLVTYDIPPRPNRRRRGIPLPERAPAVAAGVGAARAVRGARLRSWRPSVPHDPRLRELPRAHGRVRGLGRPVDRQHACGHREGVRAAARGRRAGPCPARGAGRPGSQAERVLGAGPVVPGRRARGGSGAPGPGLCREACRPPAAGLSAPARLPEGRVSRKGPHDGGVVRAAERRGVVWLPAAASHHDRTDAGRGPRARAAPAQRRATERAYQDPEILYELQAPETHAFRITHDYTERTPGEKYYFNVVRAGAHVTDPESIDLDTGRNPKFEILTGKQVNDRAMSREKIRDDAEVVVAHLAQPVAEGASNRIRLKETYTDSKSLFLDGNELVWDRAFGRPRNTVVLPPGGFLAEMDPPAAIQTLPDGRVAECIPATRPFPAITGGKMPPTVGP